MPTLKRIESKIRSIEGFDVTIRHPDHRDMRSDKTGVPSYRFGKAAKNDFTVAQWRDQRFKSVYVGYEVTVWFQNGDPAHGATKLSTVRQSYLD